MDARRVGIAGRFIQRWKTVAAVTGLVAAIAIPVAYAHGGASRPIIATTAGSGFNQDVIQYNQTTGSHGTYIQYIPVSGNPTTQSVTSGGGCATPTPSGVPLLKFSGTLYSGLDANGNPTFTNPTAAIVGAYKQRTGVCAIPQAWSIDNQPGTGAEGLDFSVGSNTSVVPSEAGRVFTEASIDLSRSDKLTGTATVELVESLGGTQVATQCFSVPAGGGAITADTNSPTAPAATACTTGNVGNGFDTVEVRAVTPGESVSVVGPSSIFFLANEICGGQQIQNSTTVNGDTVTFTVLNNGAVCKSYTGFSTTLNNSGDKSAEFDSFGAAGTDFKFSLDWGNVPYCTPDGSTPPTCTATMITLSDGTVVPQEFCTQATPAQPICTTSRNYSYVTVGGVNYTHITETYDALIDINFHY
jgi:hypothetical protein